MRHRMGREPWLHPTPNVPARLASVCRLEDVQYDFQEPSIAYGREGVSKTLKVLRELVDAGGDV